MECSLERLFEEMEMAYNWKSKRAWWEITDLALLSIFSGARTWLKEQETQSMEEEESSKGVARYCSLLPCLTCLIVEDSFSQVW